MSDRNARIRDMRRSGMTPQEIGDEFGITRERVRQLTEGIKVEPYGRTYRPHPTRDLVGEQVIERMWAEGLPIAEMARRIGMTTNSLRGRIWRMRQRGCDLPFRHGPGVSR